MIHAARLCNATICAHVHAVAVHWTKERNSQTTHLAFKWILANQKLKGCCPPNSWVGEVRTVKGAKQPTGLKVRGNRAGSIGTKLGAQGVFQAMSLHARRPCHGAAAHVMAKDMD